MAGKGTPGQTGAVQLGQELPHLMAAQALQRSLSRQVQQFFQVAAVGGEGVGRLPPLLGQFGQVGGDGGRDGHGRGAASWGAATRARAAETSSPRRSR